MFTSII